jgi:hypothetical protein
VVAGPRLPLAALLHRVRRRRPSHALLGRRHER